MRATCHFFHHTESSPPVLHAGLAFVNINIFVSVNSQVHVDKNIAAISFIFWQLGTGKKP